MNRIVAHTLCFPAVISQFPTQSVSLPIAIDDEYLSTSADAENTQPPGQPSELEFFIQTMKLYDILTEITSQFYEPTDSGDNTKATKFSSPKDPHYRLVVEIEHKLNLFWNSLPAFLKSAEASGPERPATKTQSVFRHQSRVLQNR
jgi:hypothetical protein